MLAVILRRFRSVYSAHQSDLEILKRYRDAGIDRVVLGLPSTSRDEVLRILDRSAALVRGL